ncbi:MAG: hypothetical protein HC899_39090 [Leptolyngbyaceae cyanobacterium SM1_4_3]|nr:hypothetical protein [Leptolyngbyaceae cyanobacterium SM1_4_3]
MFSATNPAAPLLAVSVPLGVQYGANAPGAITVQDSTLRVDEAQSLILAGGEVVLENASLAVALLEDGQVVGVGEGGRIDIGAVAGAGTLELTETNNLLGLRFPENLARADVRLTDTTTLDVEANNGGDLAVTARNIDILGESELLAGIERNLGLLGSQAGDIRLDATRAIRLDQDSRLANRIRSNAIGNGGDIEITTGTLRVSNGSQISASTFGAGDGGRLSISAGVVEVIGSDGDGNASAISAQVNPGATGDAQDLTIDAGRLVASDGGQIRVSTFGAGNAGQLRVQADGIELIGDDPDDGDPSGLFANVNRNATGRGGDIRILAAGRLSVQDGAALSASTFGAGMEGDSPFQQGWSKSSAAIGRATLAQFVLGSIQGQGAMPKT